jgi:hypothetical protein
MSGLEAEQGVLTSFNFNRHIYAPLIHIASISGIQVAPVHLNDGERDFVLDLLYFFNNHQPFFEYKELYLHRNQSKGKGKGKGIGLYTIQRENTNRLS